MQPRDTRFWVALLPAMAVPFTFSLFYFVFLSENAITPFVYAVSKGFLLLWPVICVLVILRTGIPRPNLRDRKHIRAIPAGVLLGALIVAIMYALMQTGLGDMVAGGSENIRKKAVQFGVLDRYWSFAWFVALGNSAFEEYYWRWFVYGHLRRGLGFVTSLILAGGSFAAHHVVVLSQFFPMTWAVAFGAAVGLGGVIWCIMLERQKTLTGAWVSHVIVDFGFLWIGYEVLFR